MLPTFSNSDCRSAQSWRGSYVGRNGSTRAGYMQVSATCPPLKCVFVNFFAERPFFLDYLPENQPLKAFGQTYSWLFIRLISL
jgi:hypothetical protein